MELVYGIVALALLALLALLLRVLYHWLGKRRADKRAAAAEVEPGATPARPLNRLRETAGPGFSDPPSDQDISPDMTGAPMPANRLARIRAAQDGGSAPAVPALATAPLRPAATQSAHAETVTAVLRRQVPVRDEPRRSWLGGLPMMPDGVEWPRGVDDQYPERGAIPLHFLAQIACEDLPANLWGGIGPRTGWLLFFINPNHFSAEEDSLRRVLYTTELGTERQPPADCGPVHDKVYTGGSYRWLEKGAVPAFWRQWPVDIVTMPNALTLHEEKGSTWKTASPDNLSQILYADVPFSKTEFAAPMPRIRPLTFGQARTAVETLSSSLRSNVRPPIDDKARELLLAEGGHGHLIEGLEAGHERLSAMAADDRNEAQTRWIAFLDAALPEYRTLDAVQLLQSIETRHTEWRAWREKLAKGCDQIATMLGRSDADAPLLEPQWQQLNATFAGKLFDHLELRHSEYRDDPFPVSLLCSRERVELKPPPGMDQIAIEYYLDPARRDQLPADYAAAQEPAWRGLYSNRPHRMGGYHDGLQSEPIEDPEFSQMLLMQIATDDAMDWCWGDAGVYFFWISPEHLEACDFSAVEVWLECC